MTIDGQAWDLSTSIEAFQQESKRLLSGMDISILQIADMQTSPEAAIRQCADFLKTFRCGSEKSGKPSKWGENDHDAPFSQGQKVYRQAIGLPLAQRYSGNNSPTVTSQAGQDNRRWASPLLFKVLPLDDGFFPVAIFCNAMTMPEGQPITLASPGRPVQKRLSLDLWRAMQDIPSHRELGWHSSHKII